MRLRRTVIATAVTALVGSMVVVVAGSSPVIPARPASVAEAPDAVSAMAAARAQGTRVEVAGERTANREVFANPQGTLTAELTPVPVRTKVAGKWMPIDTAVVRRADGSFGPKAAEGELSLSGGGKTAPLATLRRDGKSLSLYWPGDLPAPVIAGDKVTYPEVFPGADLVMYADRDGFRQHLTLKDEPAAKNPALKSIRMTIRADGLKVTADKDGALRVLDEAGAELFSAPPSVMWDAAGKRAPIAVSVVDGALELVPDAKFLADPARTFPVVVDPTLRTHEKTAWATVLSGKPEDEYWGTSGDGTYAQVGQCPRDYPDSYCNNIGEAWAYFQYDTGFLWDKDVLGITMSGVVVSGPECNEPWHDVYHIGDDRLLWSGMNWNNRLGGNRAASSKVPGVHTNCTGWKNAGFSVPTEHIKKSRSSVYFLKAFDSGAQSAWRKYNPPDMKLKVTWNRTPHVPGNLTTDPPLKAPCHHCGGIPYVGDDWITLKAQVSDPDGDDVRAQWRIHDGVETAWDANMLTSGLIHSAGIDLSKRHGKTMNWWLHASDGAASSGAASGTPFAIDREPPTVEPTVASELYTEDNRWHGGPGVFSEFVFGSQGVDDVDHYLYDWWDEPGTPIVAETRGGPARIRLAPPGDGPQTLYVRSVDRAGHKGPIRKYRTYVRAGNGPLAHWALNGDPNDSAFLGDRHGSLNGGAAFTGQGAVGAALRLDGVDDHVNAPNAIRNSAAFTVSAWVNLNRKDHARAVVSQDGAMFPGFVLWHRAEADGSNSRWVFGVPNSTSSDKGVPMATSAVGMPELNTWTHLAGVYDPEAKHIKLYVNGTLAATTPHTAKPDWASGQVRIGRTVWGTNTGVDHWAGGVDDVQIHDRALTAAEVSALVGAGDVQVAHWRFDETSGTTARNSVEGGADAVLQNGAAFTTTGAVKGGVRLDGIDDVVSTNSPLLRTDQSFTVAAQVKLDRADDGTYTVLSQDGDRICSFCLQYQNRKWTFVFPQSDSDSPAGYNWVGTSAQPPEGVWTQLTGTYDAGENKIRLYVDGELIGESTRVTPWQAKNAFRIGQAVLKGVPEQRFPGTIDEVRAYNRAISQDEVRGLVSRDNVTAGTWKFDGNPDDANGKVNATVNGTGDWTAGQTSLPDPADLALRLNGGHAATTQSVVDTDKSFTVTAWAKLDKIDGHHTVVSQQGQTASGFDLGLLPDGRWDFTVSKVDAPDALIDHVAGGAAQPGVWTHLAGVYSKSRQRIELYVNGVLAGSEIHLDGADFNGPLQIGRSKWGGNENLELFPGAIDDVSVYSRALPAGEILTMAGRDLSLAHNWTLDDGSGVTSGDAVGARQATLSGGATFAPGRVGNAVQLDGVDDVASTSGVDVRTDTSFSVSAWVRMTGKECDLDVTSRCMFSAVSQDGGIAPDGSTRPASKFRLGHLEDDNGHPGNWVFEMPEANGTITKASVDVIPSDLTGWVHLTGTYNATAKSIHLYVDGTRKGEGTLLTAWQATGGLQIGRGREGGEAKGFWKGSVDDVRMYGGSLTAERVSALYRGYPAAEGSTTLPTADKGHWKFNESTGTTAADSGGRGLTATLRGGAGWRPGRDGYTGWFDGGAGYAETAGPVVEDTSRDFSVAAWAYLKAGTHYATVFGQDAGQVSAFHVQYDHGSKTWGVVVPKADQNNPELRTVLSSEPANVGGWSHLVMTYVAAQKQVRLYVNGALSGMQSDITIPAAPGKFSIGRCRWNGGDGCYFPGGIEEVRAYGKALSDGEVRRVHDDIPPASHGYWRFDDGTPRDYSWAQNHMAVTGTATYPDGITGKALQLDGNSYAQGTKPGVSMRDSFTVAAWARLARGDKVATVLGQDGATHSGFVLQYRPEVNRWIFGAATEDSEGANHTPLVYANSLQPPALNTWTHLAGVYDHPARQLRLYVNGEHVGTKENVLLWTAWGGFTIGRGKANRVADGFFPGAIDEVTTDMGVVSPDELRKRAGWPEPAGGQLGRFIRTGGDHRTVLLGGDLYGKAGELPPGYRFEKSLGMMLTAERPGTRRVYSCLLGETDAFTSTDPACEGKTKLADLGWVYTEKPEGVATVPLYRCLHNGERFDAYLADCEGQQVDVLIGHLLAYAPLTRYYHPRIGEHDVSTRGTPPGYRHEGTYGLLAMSNEPGTQLVKSCVDGTDRFLSLDAACEGKTVYRDVGYIWTQPPAGLPSIPLYQCALNFGASAGELFVSGEANCEGQTVRGQLGYVVRAAPAAV
ncbi:LamG domain-containing protein [Amycolatopsis coloradensis]|uniref:LamG domain-containing protein n=1 Tax=Amycolatopsis coloradensis TaxID=76021 RepID=A0ACD5B3W5_9PSEU